MITPHIVSWPKAKAMLKSGAVGVLPTDTVYGLVCQASNADAVKRLYLTKRREKKPGTIIASSIEQLVELGITRRYLKAVEQYWPGAISVIIPCDDLEHVHLGLRSVAVRVTDNKSLIEVLKATGPLLSTSTNHPGQPTANTIPEAHDYFGDQVDFYVDGGDLTGRLPSTVIRVIDDTVEVLRQGAGKIDTVTGQNL
jgi:L-threonylcarbamoyladenylate synthase